MLQSFDAGALKSIETMSGSLAQRVYVSLREAILTLEFPPGMVLRKRAICEELGVSRSPVSEAIARLSAEGLVDVIPQSASRVSRFSMEEIREAAFIREALELAVVAKLAVEHTPEQVAQLTRSIRLQRLLSEDGDSDGLYQEDEAFHALLMGMTGFPGMAALVSTISLKLKRPRILLLPKPGRPDEVVREHEAIVEAIALGDAAGAREAMRHHLGQLLSRFAPLKEQHPEYFKTH